MLPPGRAAGPQPGALKRAVDHIVEDQGWLFARPLHARKRDLVWAIPAGAAAALLLAGDRHNMEAHVHSNAGAMALGNSVSNASLAALAAIPAGLFVFGRLHHDRRLQATALLAGEAAAESATSAAALKLIFRRESPGQDAAGRFFHSSVTGGSFPSTHAMLGWSIASALAHRYPGWLTQAVAYSLAAASSVPRITSEEHFPADVFVGGVLGWFIGRHAFERGYFAGGPVTPALAASPRERSAKPAFAVPEREGRGAPAGPVFVPMDSWIYPALARLAALGYISTQAAGMRPWTRTECLRQLGEAEQVLAYGRRRNTGEALRLVSALRREFGRERGSTQYVELESVYGRWLGVSGNPLVDGYNFGQTVVNDYGRPLGEGDNANAGFSAEAVAGRLSFYTRSEFQHAAPFSSRALELKPQAQQLQPVLPAAPNGRGPFPAARDVRWHTDWAAGL